jgi:hypothetical protein
LGQTPLGGSQGRLSDAIRAIVGIQLLLERGVRVRRAALRLLVRVEALVMGHCR